MTPPPEHYYTKMTVMFHAPAADHCDSSRRWTLEWNPTGGDEEEVEFQMHFADGSGGGGKMLLSRHAIDTILKDVSMGRAVSLNTPLTDFIQE